MLSTWQPELVIGMSLQVLDDISWLAPFNLRVNSRWQ